MNKPTDIESVREIFGKLGCITEKLNDSYFAMEVPEKIAYKEIRQKLEELEQEGIIGYEESCLSDHHRS